MQNTYQYVIRLSEVGNDQKEPVIIPVDHPTAHILERKKTEDEVKQKIIQADNVTMTIEFVSTVENFGQTITVDPATKKDPEAWKKFEANFEEVFKPFASAALLRPILC